MEAAVMVPAERNGRPYPLAAPLTAYHGQDVVEARTTAHKQQSGMVPAVLRAGQVARQTGHLQRRDIGGSAGAEHGDIEEGPRPRLYVMLRFPQERLLPPIIQLLFTCREV